MSDLYEVAMMVKEAADAEQPIGKGKQALNAVKGKADAAVAFLKKNPKAAGAAGVAALAAGGAYAYSKHETGAAKTAAELMYQEALEEADFINEKLAFAQDLYEDAEYAEKTAGLGDLGKKGEDALNFLKDKTHKALEYTKAKGKAGRDYLAAKGAVGKAEAERLFAAAKGKGAAGAAAAKGKGAAGLAYAKANPKYMAGAGAAALLAAGAGYMATRDNETAKTAAEVLYDAALAEAEEVNEKIAFAQQLFEEAEYAEKIAEDNGGGTQVPYLAAAGYGAGVGAAVGGGLATLQQVMTKQPVDPRLVGKAVGVGAAMGAAAAPLAQAGIAGVGALKAFVDEHRAQRAAQNVQQ